MSDLTALDTPPAPLVALTEDEVMFRDTVRQFADETVKPHVKEMDEKGVFEPSLIRNFFELGLMGIEVPEQFGGAGGTFFEAILAVEEISRIDPSAGVIVDVHPDPAQALCDGDQALAGKDISDLADVMRSFPPLLGRSVTPGECRST